MKTYCRLSIFETNSSSCHQIVINNDGEYKVAKEVGIRLGEYGWGFSVLRTIEDRISYMLTVMKSYYTEEEYIPLYDAFKEKLYKFGVETIRECCPADYSIDHPNWYIDRIMDIFNDDKLLYDYLFNGKSIIVTGNDNGYRQFDAPEEWNMNDEFKKEVW